MRTGFKEIFFSRELMLKRILPFLPLVVFLIFSLYSFFNSSASVDTGYYLTVARELSNGEWPYSDIRVGYTYNYFFLQAIPFLVRSNPDYWMFQLMHWLVSLISGLLIFCSARKLNSSTADAVLITGYFLLYQLAFGLFEIGLEPLVTVFIAATCYWGLGSKSGKLSYWAGALAGFFSIEAFFTKQFGIAAIFAVSIAGMLYWWLYRKQLAGFFGIISGILIGCALNIFIIACIFDASFPEFLSQIRGSGYGQRSSLLWLNESINWFIKSGALFFVIILFSLFDINYNKWTKIFISKFLILFTLSISMIILLTGQFYFQIYDHYYQLFAAPLAIVIASALNLLSHEGVAYKAQKILILCYIGIFSFFFLRITFTWDEVEQTRLSQQVRSVVGLRKVFLFTNNELYFTADLKPVNLKRFGLVFPNGAPIDTIARIVDEAEVVVVDSTQLPEVNKTFTSLDSRKAVRQGSLIFFFDAQNNEATH